jgi:Arc/MetJ-type ribon-helix-helix transcriptional regulator
MTSSRTTSLSVRMPNDLHAWLRQQVAKGRAASVSEVVTGLVRAAEHNDNKSNPRGK